jgi:hypothetical protein
MEMEEQTGFRAGRSGIDNIFCITQMKEKKKATNRGLHLLYIDLKKHVIVYHYVNYGKP